MHFVQKNPAKEGVWVDLTKPKGIKNPAKGVVWVDLTKTIVRKKNPAKEGIWVDITKDKKILLRGDYGLT